MEVDLGNDVSLRRKCLSIPAIVEQYTSVISQEHTTDMLTETYVRKYPVCKLFGPATAMSLAKGTIQVAVLTCSYEDIAMIADQWVLSCHAKP